MVALLVIISVIFGCVTTSKGAALHKLRPQCQSNECDDQLECPRTNHPNFFPSHEDCAHYYQCINGKPFQHRCSPGLLYNNETFTCDYNYNVNCSAAPQKSNAQCGSSVCYDQPECPKTSHHHRFPSRMNCSRYYQCVNGKLTRFSCSVGLLFNSETLTCDYNYNVNCSYRTAEESSPSATVLNASAIVIKTPEVFPLIVAPHTPKEVYTDTITSETKTASLPVEFRIIISEEETNSPENVTTDLTMIETSKMPSSIKSNPISTTAFSTFSEAASNDTTSFETTAKSNPTVTTILSTTGEPAPSETTIIDTTIKPNHISTTILSTSEESKSSETTTLDTTTKPDHISTSGPETSTEPASTTHLSTSEGPESSESTRIKTTNAIVSTTKQYSTQHESTSSTEVTTSLPPTKFVCPSRFGLFPDPNSCSRFYHCSHWVPYHKVCPSNLHFNPVMENCDLPYRAGCGVSDPTTTVAPPTTLSANDTHSSCACDFSVLPIPGDCSSYFLCIDRVATRKQCGTGLCFNPMTETCDIQANVNCTTDVQCSKSGRFLYDGSCSYFVECRDGNKSVRKCPEGLQFNATSEMCGWTGTCSGQGELPDPDSESMLTVDNSICENCSYCFKPVPSDCSSYIRCTNDTATKGRCDEGLYYNSRTELCDHDYNGDCREPEPLPECPEPFGYFPYPGECGLYLQCLNGTAIVKSCPGTLHFDPRKKHCNWPWEAGCGVAYSTPTPELDPEKVNCNCDCCSKPVGNDCRSFILCILKVGFGRSCSSGLFYNPQTENCDLPENVECPVSPPGESSYNCKDHQGRFPHPADCRKFIHCYRGIAHVKICPSNLHFNPHLKVCDWPYSAGCQSEVVRVL